MTLRGTMITGRWHETVAAALPDGEVIFSTGTDDYQGSVAIVARLDDGRWLHYDWSYGSCSGCDAWEDEPTEKVTAEIAKGAAIMDRDHFADYLVSAKASKASWLHDGNSESYSYERHVGVTVDELAALLAARSP